MLEFRRHSIGHIVLQHRNHNMLHLLRRTSLPTKPQLASTWNFSLRSMQLVSNNRPKQTVALQQPLFNNSQQRGKLLLTMLGAALTFSTAVASTHAKSEPEVLAVEDELTPLYEPVFRESGMLKVSDVHTISYKVYGNPKGKPVLCVHGGPGAGTGTGKVSADILSLVLYSFTCSISRWPLSLIRKHTKLSWLINVGVEIAYPLPSLREMTHGHWWRTLRKCASI